ncbi:ferredoxin--NADP reductase [Notoacmeibacter sp. MSK16QG-6]|uniref:ferredoxin--NADP reductase n=1 Tax=Notoacmeibacter sp. MSK16QG-6 TaxID=2957982 RepID=UPI00209D8E9D|nr:ferredoxin--NADP reductase [Notoacmeibacter sp. MSK16QG-6]MCP1199508.1 ferredoxin--NADP reductase [Notoacmeibacter sp. MSK16QG-6]
MSTYPLPVVRRRAEASDTTSLWLQVPSDLVGAFRYRAGQFIAVQAEIGGETLVRQYSLSSTPGAEADLRITVKKVPDGHVSSWLVDRVAEGEVLEVASPRGVFFKEPDVAHHVLLLAAGSGVAPLLPIAQILAASPLGHDINFVYGNRQLDGIILHDEVDELAALDNVTVEHVLTRPHDGWNGGCGRIDRAFIQQNFARWTASTDKPVSAYLCGPEGFMDAAESALMACGLSSADIRRESFDLVLNDDGAEDDIRIVAETDPGDEGECEAIVAVVGGEEVTVVPEPGESILSALIRVEADVPYSCQEGTCSSCISKLTSGAAEVRPAVRQTLRDDDLEEGLVLACLARPTTRRIRIDFDEF